MSTEYGNVAPVGDMAVVTLENVSKSFGDNQVLKNVSAQIRVGEVVGLLGPNGAGKSTLMKIINGVESPSSGSLVINGASAETERFSVRDAVERGIFCVYQELSLCTNLTASENFLLDGNLSRNLSEKAQKQKTRQAIEEIFPGVDVPVAWEVAQLSLAQRQIVEIARAATHPELKLLILDEPTSALAREYVKSLHGYLRRLAQSGISILYVSHKLEEIRAVTDRVIILKNGAVHFEGSTAGVSASMLLELLSGNARADLAESDHTEPEAIESEPILSLSGISAPGLRNINLTVRRGEIVGIAGLEGAGQQALLRAIDRLGKTRKGSVPRHAYVTGDRQTEGIFPLWDIYNNVLISALDRISSRGIIDQSAADSLVGRWFERLKFRAKTARQPIVEVSGGTQQKALIARGLASGAELLLLDDPTRGVDVETKQEIYAIMREAKAEGRSALFFSTEDMELEQCDRVYVLSRGGIAAELLPPNINVPNIIRASYQETDKNPAVQSATTPSRGGFPFAKSSRSFLAMGLLIVILAINGVADPSSIGPTGLDLLLGGALPLALAAMGQMFIIMAGDIDLGLGAALGLINVITAVFLVKSPWLGWLALLSLVAAYGGMAVIIHKRRLPAIIVTLGASFVWLGVALMIQPSPGGSVPNWLNNALNLSLPLIPEPVYLLVLFVGAATLILYRTRYGRVLRGFGSNPAAVYHSGKSALKAHVVLYIAGAVCLVLSGLAITASSGAADANASSVYTLSSIAAVIVGGGEFLGGIVSPVGAVAAAVAISLISSLLAFLNVNSFYEAAATGIILLGSLAMRRMGRGGS